MVKFPNVKQTLIDRTITVLGTEGMDKTTTKAIVAGTGINEVYIYRHFANKEDLLSKAFDKLDEELAEKAMLHIPVMYMLNLEYETRCRFFFTAMWDCLLSDREGCFAYIRYYYSPYFIKNSAQAHKERFAPLIAKFSDAFKENANVWMLMNHILTTMLGFAVKVYDGHIPNNRNTEEHVFRVVYHSVHPYLKRAKEEK